MVENVACETWRYEMSSGTNALPLPCSCSCPVDALLLPDCCLAVLLAPDCAAC